MGYRRGHSFHPELHTRVYRAEIYTIKACIMENIEKDYIGGNMYILSDTQAAVKVLDGSHINSKLFWDCHQSMMKLAEHDRI